MGSADTSFRSRHLGPGALEVSEMLALLGYRDLAEFINAVIPSDIRIKKPLTLRNFPGALSELAATKRLQGVAAKNQLWKSFIGMGYCKAIVPTVIQRTILENPSWYTHYTPYQPEISQGRLEALLNFQTLICDLSGLDIANSSLLDEGTAAAEALGISLAKAQSEREIAKPKFLIASSCHPQTIDVVKTRAEALEVLTEIVDPSAASFSEKFSSDVVGVLVQYPNTHGAIEDYSAVCSAAHGVGALVTFAADPLALVLLKAPAEFGADIVIGSAQRFGVPLGFGGPHAAFLATRDALKRLMPGRLVGVSKDTSGDPALRLSLQTREQHIRREKATSNICTAQVLLAVMASMYAVYHGPYGLQAIALEVQRKAALLAAKLKAAGIKIQECLYFDTVSVPLAPVAVEQVRARAHAKRINLRYLSGLGISVTLDEQTTEADIDELSEVIAGRAVNAAAKLPTLGAAFERRGAILAQPVFNRYHTETEFLRYVKRLESKDLSLATSMIPLGSCTMKLNAASEMYPVSWREFADIHPFVPADQWRGYAEMFSDLESALADITGFSAVSLQPNAGSQGELAGLLVVRAYQRSRNEGSRNVCLIPKSAHGTNPASAAMAGLEVVIVNCDEQGNVDLTDLEAKARQHKERLSTLMVTYPSTHGVFEAQIQKICAIVHECGGQVYMDGANLNAHVGLTSPEAIGADVCHINLHKTFCIPHGGGGPGMGPICVRSHLAPFLPSHPLCELGHASDLLGMGIGPISAAPYGSAGILCIPWMYIAMMGAEGLTRATEIAILNANYLAKKLEGHYQVLYRGAKGLVAHECIVDLRPLKKTSGIEAEDVAKRLMDYGFHAPTVSFPVAGTLMIEPTESESKAELDRFSDAMIAIRREIRDIEEGRSDPKNNPLVFAPHTAKVACGTEWNRSYSREVAAFPAPWTRESKFWPTVGRIDGTYGDRNLVCTCPSPA